MRILAGIPARLQSQRLPEKVLRQLGDKSMIRHVYERAKSCDAFDEVIVATDSPRVLEHVEAFGGKVMMTLESHRSGTERIAELARHHTDYDIIVNVQGDQPFLDQHMLTTLVKSYLDGDSSPMSTVAAPLRDTTELDNPHTVKVILDQDQHAIYFSRSHIPHGDVDLDNSPVYHHLGLYAYTSSFLQTYSELPSTPLERLECLEQLRVLEHGHKIKVNLIDRYVPEINTEEDILLAQQLNLI